MKTSDHWNEITALYDLLSSVWFKDTKGYIKATLRRLSGEHHEGDGYHHGLNTIQINASEREIDTPINLELPQDLKDILSEEDNSGSPDTTQSINEPWPEWKKALVHEVIHEYEFKALRSTSEEGVALHKRWEKKNFTPPEKHAALFFTAVCDRAAHFHLSPDELCSRL